MKWLFGLLILTNLALYLWGTWYHQPLVGLEQPAPRPNVAPEKMKLLSEGGVRLTLRVQPTPTAPVQTPGEARCYQLGPFATLEGARAAAVKLDAWGLAHRRLAEFQTLGQAYRVYLPPLPSKEAAERKRRELTKLGFTDHALIQQEIGMENAISLGIFTVEQNAQARVRQLARRGVRAAVQPIPNVQPIYWLALTGQVVNEKLGEVSLTRFALEDWGSPNVGLRPVACNDNLGAGDDVTKPDGRR